MMSADPVGTLAEQIVQAFEKAGLNIAEFNVRRYPGETIFIVSVATGDLPQAAALGNSLDSTIRQAGVEGFVTVRADDARPESTQHSALKDGVNDPRGTEFIRLVNARSRTSETQPSLTYVPDAAVNISTVTTARHHLVFGRRGAGKTALLVEAKRILEQGRGLTVWINLQTYRQTAMEGVFLWIVRRWIEAMEASLTGLSGIPIVVTELASLAERIESELAKPTLTVGDIVALVPRIQHAVRRYQDSTGRPVFVFLDDFHYLPRLSQPWLLDTLHGCMRDCNVWMKIATIKHLSKWFQASPPMGLQTTHDAGLIDLDVSLQEPSRAKDFLQRVLQAYAAYVNVRSLSSLFSPEALDRLVLASGAVPRDYLTLGAEAVRKAQLRPKGRVVGAQDVNRAAGDAAHTKIRELEEDLAANAGEAGRTLNGLSRLRSFCLEATKSSYFRVDFADKEQNADAYTTLSMVMDLRLVHLVNSSVSDERKAGARSEVFMLDLSQISGERFRKGIRVIDFRGKHIIARETGKKESVRTGDTPNALLAILRRGPLLRLQELEAPAGASIQGPSNEQTNGDPADAVGAPPPPDRQSGT